jgi:hypothetical protein
LFNKHDRVLWWISKGFALLPCQPGKKSLVTGFGVHLDKITNSNRAAQWWRGNSAANIAALALDDFFILDFDILEVYKQWANLCPDAARSYTEGTPRGGTHVFLRGQVPAGVVLVDGAEIKRAVLVAPSVVDGKEYKVLSDHENFVSVDPVECLSSLSKTGHASPHFLKASQTRHAQVNPLSRIEQIKKHWTISHVLKLYRPEIELIGRGEFLTCKCPFHRDSKPSFYLNDLVGVWGCHACKVRGDVINLYSRFEAVSVREAISRMWAVMA